MFVEGVRPPPIPRKPRRPNDTAKRRAEEAPGAPKHEAGEASKRLKDSPVDEGQLIQQHGEPLETPIPPDVQVGTTLDPFDHDQDFSIFDDRPFDTIEENEHYLETRQKSFPPEDQTAEHAS